MLTLPPTLHVRTRVPLAAWAVAAVITLFSLMSSLLHATHPSDRAMPRAEQDLQTKTVSYQAKV
jgi:hypothetical protein